jgi:hypothetical protein
MPTVITDQQPVVLRQQAQSRIGCTAVARVGKVEIVITVRTTQMDDLVIEAAQGVVHSA